MGERLVCLIGVTLGTAVVSSRYRSDRDCGARADHFNFDPVASLIMLAGIYYGAQYRGSTTAILLNLPSRRPR